MHLLWVLGWQVRIVSPRRNAAYEELERRFYLNVIVIRLRRGDIAVFLSI